MLKIAVCDDMPDQLAQLSGLTREYLETAQLSAEVRAFSHPDKLLTACETEPFHIYLLDMVMPMVNGLELGRAIRRASREAQIIYVTSEPGYALDAYAVNPLHYLLKPVNKDALWGALALAASKAEGAETAVTVRTKDGLRTLTAGQIVCCEYVRHAALYTLLDGERVETTTLAVRFGAHLAPLLQDKRFLAIGSAFVLNMSRVEKLNHDGFVLRGGVSVPVPVRQYTAARKAYLDYRLGGEEA